MIDVKLLGKPKISIEGIDVTVNLSKKGVAILVYMLSSKNKSFTRERLATMFWYNFDKSSSLANLRYTLWKVRKVFEDHGVNCVISNIGRNEVSIQKDYFIMDIDIFNRWEMEERSGLIESSRMYRGDFMDGFLVVDSLDFNDWLFNTREEFQLQYFNLEFKLADIFIGDGEIHRARDEFKKLIHIDPINEEVYRRLIQMFINNGNRVAALKYYTKIKEQLREELNISPNKELKSLYRLITEDKIKEEKKPKMSSGPVVIRNRNKKIALYQYFDNHRVALDGVTASKHAISVGQLPGKRIAYEGIYEILREIELITENNKEKISFLRNRKSIDDYFLFTEVVTILEKLPRIEINISNLGYMDEKTIDYISILYRYRMKGDINLTLIYNGSRPNPRVEDFIQAFGL